MDGDRQTSSHQSWLQTGDTIPTREHKVTTREHAVTLCVDAVFGVGLNLNRFGGAENKVNLREKKMYRKEETHIDDRVWLVWISGEHRCDQLEGFRLMSQRQLPKNCTTLNPQPLIGPNEDNKQGGQA